MAARRHHVHVRCGQPDAPHDFALRRLPRHEHRPVLAAFTQAIRPVEPQPAFRFRGAVALHAARLQHRFDQRREHQRLFRRWSRRRGRHPDVDAEPREHRPQRRRRVFGQIAFAVCQRGAEMAGPRQHDEQADQHHTVDAPPEHAAMEHHAPGHRSHRRGRGGELAWVEGEDVAARLSWPETRGSRRRCRASRATRTCRRCSRRSRRADIQSSPRPPHSAHRIPARTRSRDR